MDQPPVAESFTILFVESNQEDFCLTSKMLQDSVEINSSCASSHLQINRAESYEAAMNKLTSEQKIDCILLDLSLPDALDIEAFYYLKAIKPEIPIVILSPASNYESAHSALIGGAQDYLLKEDINSGALRRTIENAIERNRLLSEVNRLKVKAEQSDREKAELIYNFASDSQELVNTAYKLSISSKYVATNWDKDKLVTKVGSMIKSLEEMLEYFKDYSLLELGQLAFEESSLELKDCIAGIVDEMAVFDDGVAYRIEEDLTNLQPFTIIVDEKRLKKIVQCLYKNMLLFTTTDDVIQIKVSSTLKESIQANGIGINFELKIKDKQLTAAEEHLLSDSISQSDLASYKKYGINGLELSIITKVIKLMHGQIWLSRTEKEELVLNWTVSCAKAIFG